MGRQIELFHGFVGQRRNVRLLKRYISSTKNAGKPLSHTLLTGPVGSGKTELAKAIAREIGTTCHCYCASRQFSPLRLAEAAPKWSAHDIVFVDEIQSLNDDVQELFNRVVKEGKAQKLDQSGSKPRLTGAEIDLPPITLIAGTDQPGKLLKSLRSRFSLILPFEPYSRREMEAIVGQTASQSKMLLSSQATNLLAAASRGNPRLVNQRIALLGDFYDTTTGDEFSIGRVKQFLKANGIEPSGMTREDRRYLEFLNQFDGRDVALRTIALGIQSDERHVATQIEPWLIGNHLIGISPSGRFLTALGKAQFETKEADKE
jgi:Holliday junction DNA helicase RuvB